MKSEDRARLYEDWAIYDDDDLLNDYLLMVENFDQDDVDVTYCRQELERRGYTFLTREPEEDDDLEETYWTHPSLTIGERNPGLTKGW